MTAALGKSTKRYFWLKLKEGFFNQKEIKKLRKIAGGDTYTIILLELQLLGLKENGYILFSGIEDTLEEEIALELNEDINDVRTTLDYFKKIGWITVSEENNMPCYIISQLDVGSETSSAARMRKAREAQKNKFHLLQSSHCDMPVTNSDQKVTTEIEIETELDIEQESETELQQEQSSRYSLDKDSISPKKYDIPDQLRLELIQKYGKEKVSLQIENLCRANNIKNPSAWLYKALENNYNYTSQNSYAFPRSNCPDCHGSGKIAFTESLANQTVYQICRCVKMKN